MNEPGERPKRKDGKAGQDVDFKGKRHILHKRQIGAEHKQAAEPYRDRLPVIKFGLYCIRNKSGVHSHKHDEQ
ncbi:hypothetical protein D3C74_394420 [compost metagenome]